MDEGRIKKTASYKSEKRFNKELNNLLMLGKHVRIPQQTHHLYL